MLKKLSFLMIIAIFLTACGASAPARDAVNEKDAQLIYGPAESASANATVESAPGSGLLDVTESPEPAVCDAEYFLFTKTTNTITDDAGLPLLYENQCIPRFSSMDPIRNQWVDGILEGIGQDFASNSRNLQAYAQEFIELNGEEHFYSYSNYQQLGVARHDSSVVSLLGLSSLYSGGTHPNSIQTAWNLDITGQRILRLEDVIREDGAEQLAALVRASVDEKFHGVGLFEDYAATIDSSMVYGNMTPYWYLNDTGMVIFYNQYELGPYAAGIIKAELTYEDLQGILREEYLPIPSTGTPGDLLLRGDWSGWHRIPITIEAEGEKLMVGVEGKVYQVQLSEVLWLEDTPIAQELIFSARTLCQNDVLEITGGFDDEMRSFAIEFMDGLGQHRIYYLHLGELSDEP